MSFMAASLSCRWNGSPLRRRLFSEPSVQRSRLRRDVNGPAVCVLVLLGLPRCDALLVLPDEIGERGPCSGVRPEADLAAPPLAALGVPEVLPLLPRVGPVSERVRLCLDAFLAAIP